MSEILAADLSNSEVMTEADRYLRRLFKDVVFLEFPGEELGHIPDDDLGVQLGAWAGMAGWIMTEVAAAESRKDVAEAAYEVALAKAFRSIGDGMVTERKQLAALDETVLRAQRVLLIQKAIQRFLRAELEKFDRYFQAVSRELTRRLKQYEREGRANTFGGTP